MAKSEGFWWFLGFVMILGESDFASSVLPLLVLRFVSVSLDR